MIVKWSQAVWLPAVLVFAGQLVFAIASSLTAGSSAVLLVGAAWLAGLAFLAGWAGQRAKLGGLEMVGQALAGMSALAMPNIGVTLPFILFGDGEELPTDAALFLSGIVLAVCLFGAGFGVLGGKYKPSRPRRPGRRAT